MSEELIVSKPEDLSEEELELVLDDKSTQEPDPTEEPIVAIDDGFIEEQAEEETNE